MSRTVQTRGIGRVGAAVVLAGACSAGAQTAYTDTRGREWQHVSVTTSLTWTQVAAVMPTDGVTPAVGTLAGRDVTGLVWASDQQVRELFTEFVPELATSDGVGGPGYVLVGLGFFSWFRPTWEAYTIVGGFFYLSGWTSTEEDGLAVTPSVGASYNPHDAGFSLAELTPVGTPSQYRGVWMFRPAPPCPADTNNDGTLSPADFSAWIAAFNAQSPACDQNGDGACSPADFSAWIGNFNAGC